MDVSGLFDIDSSSRKAIIEQWDRALVGLRSYLFMCTQTFVWSDDVICGDHLDPANTLGWDKVDLNLPGDQECDPTKPWVYRFNSVASQMASFFTTYIDDIRTGYHSNKSC